MPAIDPEDTTAEDATSRARKRLGASSVGDDVVRAVSPAWHSLSDVKTVSSVVLTVVAFALVDLDGTRAPSPFDPLDLALRMLAFTSLVRTCILVSDGVRRFRALRATRDHALVFLDDALVVFHGAVDVLPRSSVLGAAGASRVDGRPALVVLARRSVGSPAIRLGFTADIPASSVATRIERYVRETEREPDVSARPEFPAPTRDPRAEFDRVIAAPRDGESIVTTGFDWLRRAPFAAPAFVAVFGERLVHVARDPAYGALRLGLPETALLVICALVPIGWLALGLLRIRSMGGAAMVLTPAELLVRGRAGLHRVAWPAIDSVDLTSRRTFAMLTGRTFDRALVVERADGASLRFDESILGEPVEIVRAILEGYSDGAASAAPASSQGSGGGGGISAT